MTRTLNEIAAEIGSEHASALDQLRELLPPGTTVHTVLRHVSQSGMTRWISPVLIKDSQVFDLTYLVSEVTRFNRSSNYRGHEGLKVEGAGMDMGFHLVYSLSRTLYPNGFRCTGENGPAGCPSNDHVNERREGSSFDTSRVHADGGYALQQRWL